MIELAFWGIVAIAGLSFWFAYTCNRYIRVVACSLFFGGLFFYFFVLLLIRLKVLVFPGHPYFILWFGFVVCLVGFSSFLGYALQRAGAGGLWSIRLILLAAAVSFLVVAATLNHSKFVERHVFDKNAPSKDSDYIVAYGWPAAFIADISEAHANPLGLPGDRILLKPFLFDWLVIFYLITLLTLKGKRLCS